MDREQNPTERYYKRLGMLKSERTSWDAHWRELSQYLMPISGRFLGGADTYESPNQGNKLNDNIIDGTATRSIIILAAGMQGGLTSPARPWFRLAPADPNMMESKAVRMWTETVRDLMLKVFNASNFYNTIHMMYQELATFGTAAMLVEEDYDSVIRCRAYTAGEYYLGLDKFYRVDTLYRVFWATAGQLVKRFGEKNCSDSVLNMVRNRQQDTWVKVIHCIEPREDMNDASPAAKDMPWRSVYFEWGKNKDKLLGESGYREFPVMAPRWNVVGCDVYGRGPGMDALGDVKMLQTLQTDSLIAIKKMVDPPMNAPASMKNTEVVTGRPGEVNFIPGSAQGQGVTSAYQMNFNVQAVETKIGQVQTAIRQAFFNDLFLMLAGEPAGQMTATEVRERHEEKLLMVGPVLERLQSECLDPLIDRTYAIMDRAGILPKPPQELRGQDLKVEYISLLAQAQKLVATTAIERAAQFAANLIPVAPEVKFKFDFMEAIDQYAESVGVPPNIVRSDEEARAGQQAAEQQAATGMAMERINQGADAAQKLSQTPVGGAEQSMLDKLLGGGGPAQAGAR